MIGGAVPPRVAWIAPARSGILHFRNSSTRYNRTLRAIVRFSPVSAQELNISSLERTERGCGTVLLFDSGSEIAMRSDAARPSAAPTNATGLSDLPIDGVVASSEALRLVLLF